MQPASALLALLPAAPFGSLIAQTVQDEVTLSRNYLRMAPDVILLLMIALSAYTITPVLLLLALLLIPPGRHVPYAQAAGSGILLGLGTLLSLDLFFTLVTLAITLNFIIGTLARSMRYTITHTLVQAGTLLAIFVAQQAL